MSSKNETSRSTPLKVILNSVKIEITTPHTRNDVIVRRGKTLSYQENSSYLVQ
jgi:hypothetical protein